MHSSVFTTVEMNLDIFLGGYSFDTTEQHIIGRVTSKGIRVINCVSVEANVGWYKPFKIIVSPNDRDKLLSHSLWPLNTFVRKLHNIRSRNSRQITSIYLSFIVLIPERNMACSLRIISYNVESFLAINGK